MKEFVLIFRNSANPGGQPSPEQMQEIMSNWMNSITLSNTENEKKSLKKEISKLSPY
ncbi:hypothetical protein [Desertivirga arenae]|uniref:hypothetical protein n=1 Tax=Desertivirga arenae TaxID=2810309 RepID=UPI001A96F263|nr:hypothetical protein [Pedobacter sp. SYSU D00823]